MPTITATAQDSWPPRVLVSVTGLTLGDSIALFRVAGGERTAVRAGASDAVTDTSFLRTDAELPFGTPVSYVAVVNDNTEYATSAVTYSLPGGKVAVTDAVNGNAAEVVILAWDEKTRERQSTVFRVGGRNVVVSGQLGQPSGELELFTDTTTARDDLDAVLVDATEGVVQIRQPGGYDGIDSYLSVTGAAERRWSQDGSDQRRVWALRVVEVEGWAPLLEAQGVTLQAIADIYDVAGPNLVANGLFEVDASGWVGSNATIGRSTLQAHQGVASLLITPNGSSASGGANATTTVPVVAGRNYLVSMWVYCGLGWTDLGPAVDWANGGGSYITTGFGGGAVAAATWVFKSAVLTAPVGAATATVRARHGSTPAASRTWYVDEVSFTAEPLSLADLAADYATLLDLAQADLS